MLIGPRMRDGDEGYLVVTPLERAGGASKILVCRGWIPKNMKEQRARVGPEALPAGEVTVQGLLRENPKKNRFTPDNKPESRQFFFPDIAQMAQLSGAQPVWMEETTELELFEMLRRQQRGIPMGRQPSVNLSNNHAQYIFTWYVFSSLVGSFPRSLISLGMPWPWPRPSCSTWWLRRPPKDREVKSEGVGNGSHAFKIYPL
jgi:surfeit locus 1 family protein